MDNSVALQNDSGYKFVHGNRFPNQLKDKVFSYKISWDLLGWGVECVRRMQVGGDMENNG